MRESEVHACGAADAIIEPVQNRGSIMLDREGFRPNVGIVLLNSRNQVFWGKR